MPVAHSFVGDLSDRGPTRVRVSRPAQVVRTFALLLWIVIGIAAHFLTRFLVGARANRWVHRSFHGGVARLFGMRVHAVGTVHTTGGTLYVANHASYLDVFVLGCLLDASFVAKAEVSGWPVLGVLAKLQDTLFFARDPRQAREQIEILRARLREGRSLILFPEGTSTDGVRVQPFRSTLLAAAADLDGAAVQAVSVAYKDFEGAPMAPADRDFYAWYLPMTFLPHFTNGLGIGRSEVEVRFAPAETDLAGVDRKALSARLEAQVRAGLVASLGDAAAPGP